MRALVEANLDAFPPGTDVPFLLAWIERESDGRHDAQSFLGEVGYFQLHPAEIDDIFGKAARAAVVTEIKSNPTASLVAGAMLLRHYDDAIPPGVMRRGDLYHGLLKTMHTSRPQGVLWLKHVTAALDRLPTTFNEFLATAVAIIDGKARGAANTRLPPLPSCSAWQLLQRRDEMALPGERPINFSLAPLFATQAMWNTSALFGAIGFPGVDFGKPLDSVFVSSGWGRPRPARNGVHQGLDMRARVGTPVFAVEDGTVAQVTTGQFAGRFVSIQHDAGWTSRYMHLETPQVAVGQSVLRGQQIALSGDTGIQNTPPHLHFDLLLEESRLADYTKKFGTPRGGFGVRHRLGVGVPAEPLIPVDGYADLVIRDARRNGIPLHDPPFPWREILIGTGALAAGWFVFSRRARIRAKIGTWL